MTKSAERLLNTGLVNEGYLIQEVMADRVTTMHPGHIPEPLQTAAYTRALLSSRFQHLPPNRQQELIDRVVAAQPNRLHHLIENRVKVIWNIGRAALSTQAMQRLGLDRAARVEQRNAVAQAANVPNLSVRLYDAWSNDESVPDPQEFQSLNQHNGSYGNRFYFEMPGDIVMIAQMSPDAADSQIKALSRLVVASGPEEVLAYITEQNQQDLAP